MPNSHSIQRVSIVEAYGSAIRDLINARVQHESGTIRELLRLNKAEDWSFLCAAMDIVSDACSALENFLLFGLDGPTKYDDFGEKYLRLYGLLSASYIQQEAVLKLWKLLNVPNPIHVQGMFEELAIRSLRHKLAAHSTGYLDKDTGILESYVPVRVNLEGLSCSYFNNETMKMQSVDLELAITEHCDKLIGMLDTIYEKSIKTILQGQADKFPQFHEVLEDLRTRRDGGSVISMPGGGKLVMNVLGPSSTAK